MTRNERVLQYMQDFGSISSLEAFRDLGCTRLSAAVFQLKQAGYNIQTQREKAKNRYGETVYFCRYSLGGKGAV